MSCERCGLSIEVLGVDVDLVQRMQVEPEVTDFLLSALTCAASTGRLGAEGPPAVEVRDPTSLTSLHYRNAAGQLDAALLVELLHLVPNAAVRAQWLQCSDESFVNSLNAIDLRLLPTLRWLLCSTPTHLRPLSPELWANVFPRCLHQFAILLSTPEEEAAFQQRKARQGHSATVWYSPASEEWFGILRKGLKGDEEGRLGPLYLDASSHCAGRGGEAGAVVCRGVGAAGRVDGGQGGEEGSEVVGAGSGGEGGGRSAAPGAGHSAQQSQRAALCSALCTQQRGVPRR